MVRNYKPKNTKEYTTEELNAAINKVITVGLTIAAAQRQYPLIPYNTLRAHVNGDIKSFKAGRPTYFSYDQEQLICNALLVLSDAGFPADNNQLKRIVSSFCIEINRPDIFINRVPSVDWIDGFRKRWKSELTKVYVFLLFELLSLTKYILFF